jgi:phosphoglucosamine mutase
MKPKLFGSSGIRGIVNKEITPALTQRIGAALATIHQGGTAIVGRDARISGQMLEGTLVSGLASAGMDSIAIGLVPTPLSAWTVKYLGADAGIEITASHNPARYNGLKIFNNEGMSLTQKEQLEVENVLENELYRLAPWDCVGTVETIFPIEDYINELSLSIELNFADKIACDLFNGATCTVAPLLMDEFSLRVDFINGVAEGTFPSGNPEPSEKSLKRLGKFMTSREITIGFGFDGDGDRMMLVDSSGKMVDPDRLLASFAAYVVEKNQGGTVVTHVGASMSVDEMVKKAGGNVIRTPVGDAFITEAMEENQSVFGGEPVGTWVHPDVHMCPDGLLSALKLLEALQETGVKLEEFLRETPSFPLRREKLECPHNKKGSALKYISSNYRDTFNNVQSINTVDGVRLELEEGWVLIRPSGTEPLIRITVEAKKNQYVKEYIEKGILLIKKSLRELK